MLINFHADNNFNEKIDTTFIHEYSEYEVTVSNRLAKRAEGLEAKQCFAGYVLDCFWGQSLYDLFSSL